MPWGKPWLGPWKSICHLACLGTQCPDRQKCTWPAEKREICTKTDIVPEGHTIAGYTQCTITSIIRLYHNSQVWSEEEKRGLGLRVVRWTSLNDFICQGFICIRECTHHIVGTGQIWWNSASSFLTHHSGCDMVMVIFTLCLVTQLLYPFSFLPSH